MNIDLSRLTVLVVEDSIHMREIIRAMLTGFGTRRVLEAEDGAAGMELLERADPDLVILDWEMPVLDGAGMVKLIRRPEHPKAQVPIIMLTAHTERTRVVQARNAGVHEVLSKPVSPKALYQRIATVILQPREFIQTADYFGPRPREVVMLG